MNPVKPHTVATDPGIAWIKDEAVAIDAPPDDDSDPAPEARWPSAAVRTGLCGAVSPNVVPLPGGRYRMYYTQLTPRPGHPSGANDYDNCTARILSAVSADGSSWTPEPGVRLSPRDGGAGEFRVVSSDVVPIPGGGGRLRMYFECCPGTQEGGSTIRSAVSDDGLDWQLEPGERLESGGYNAPRLLHLDDGTCRLYCSDRNGGIASALSDDGGLTFRMEPGKRIEQELPYEAATAFAPEVLRIDSGGYRMYYAGYSDRTPRLRPDRGVRRRTGMDQGAGAGRRPGQPAGPRQVLGDVRRSAAGRSRGSHRATACSTRPATAPPRGTAASGASSAPPPQQPEGPSRMKPCCV